MNETPDVLREAINAPMGEILRSVGLAIADAQIELDRSSMVVAELMSGQRVLRDLDTGELIDAAGDSAAAPTVIDSRFDFGYTRDDDGTVQPIRVSALELGFVPTFYQFVDNVIELKIALRVNQDSSRRAVATGTAVDGAYASTYGYDVRYASVFKTKLTPVPPPPALDDWLREEQESSVAEEAAATDTGATDTGATDDAEPGSQT